MRAKDVPRDISSRKQDVPVLEMTPPTNVRGTISQEDISKTDIPVASAASNIAKHGYAIAPNCHHGSR